MGGKRWRPRLVLDKVDIPGHPQCFSKIIAWGGRTEWEGESINYVHKQLGSMCGRVGFCITMLCDQLERPYHKENALPVWRKWC